MSTSSSNDISKLDILSSLSIDLANLFECPVCLDYVLPPILQCQSGHLVCANCRPKLSCCPTCKGSLGNIRNLAMEKVASNVMFPCKYSTSGCTVSLMHTKKVDHEDACKFQPCNCPCRDESCKWQGLLEQVISHIITCHNSIKILQGKDIVFVANNIIHSRFKNLIIMQSCFGHHFILLLEKLYSCHGLNFFAMIVQLIGSRKQAENFTYRLEMIEPSPILSWKGRPHSILEEMSVDTFKNIFKSDYLVFQASSRNRSKSDTFKLRINVTISMTSEKPEKAE